MCPLNDAMVAQPIAVRTIDPMWSVNELLRLYPAAGRVLNDYGIDTCCGGGDSLEDAARAANIDVTLLLGALSTAIPVAGR